MSRKKQLIDKPNWFGSVRFSYFALLQQQAAYLNISQHLAAAN